jgi:hypothetical protein
VQDDKKVFAKPDDDPLPGPLNVLDGQADDRFDRRIHRSQNERTDKLQVLEALAGEVHPKRFDVQDDVWELRQLR